MDNKDGALDLSCKCFALKKTSSKCFAGWVVKWRLLIGQSLSATYILLPQLPYLNIVEKKYKRQNLMPAPIILVQNADPVELQIQLQQISQYTAKQTESTCDDARQRDIYTVRA